MLGFIYGLNHLFRVWQIKHLLSEIINEPQHNKTNKITCATSEDSDQPGHLSSLISLHCPSEGLGPWLHIQHTANLLSGAQADLSLRWVHIILLVLSCGDS